MKKGKIAIFSAAAALIVGALSGFLSREGMRLYTLTAVKPPLSPPAWLFPIVWSVLYILMGVAAARVWRTEPSQARSMGLNGYVAQLIVNFFWSLLFFNAAAYGFAALWLVLLLSLVAAMTVFFAKCDTLAAALQIPYLFWLCFALYLNVAVYFLNK